MAEKKRVSDSMTEQVHILMHSDINGQGRLFGGQLLKWIDEVAGVTARRHCGRNVTTAAIDQLSFKDGMRFPINRAYMVLVCMGDDGKPTEVPGLIPETETEKMEWENGQKRRELRMMRRREGY